MLRQSRGFFGVYNRQRVDRHVFNHVCKINDLLTAREKKSFHAFSRAKYDYTSTFTKTH